MFTKVIFSKAGTDFQAILSCRNLPKKEGGVGLGITLKIKEQTPAVNAIKTCWLQSVTGCLGEIWGPRTAEHLNKRQQNVFYEDINVPLNYRAMPETDCTQLPEACIISIYKRTPKPIFLFSKKEVQNKTLSGWAKLLTVNYNSYNHTSLQGKIKFLETENILSIVLIPFFPTKYILLKQACKYRRLSDSYKRNLSKNNL